MECLKSITLANGVCVQQQCRTMNILIKYHWIYSLQATKCKWLLLEKRPKLHSFLSKPPEIQMQLLFMTLQILRFVTHHQSYRAATHLVISLYPSIKYLNMMEAFNRVASILHLKIPWAYCFTVSWMVVDFYWTIFHQNDVESEEMQCNLQKCQFKMLHASGWKKPTALYSYKFTKYTRTETTLFLSLSVGLIFIGGKKLFL